MAAVTLAVGRLRAAAAAASAAPRGVRTFAEVAAGSARPAAGTAEEQTDSSSGPAAGSPGPLRLYESKTNLEPLAKAARSQCLFGNALALCGFAGVLAGSPTAPLAAQAFVCVGAAATTYKNAVLARRELGNIGMRHVEQVTLVRPVGLGAVASSAGDDGEPGGEASATMPAEDQLKGVHELELVVRTANMEVQFTLGAPLAAWEGAKYSGLVADERPAFKDVSEQLLHFEEVSGWGKPGAPVSSDPKLLHALLKSDKVVAERKARVRDDLEESGSLMKLTADGLKHFEAMLDRVKKPEDGSSASAKLREAANARRSPAMEMQDIGRQSLVSGGVFFLAGLLFLGRLAGGGDDPTLRDVWDKYQGSIPGRE